MIGKNKITVRHNNKDKIQSNLIHDIPKNKKEECDISLKQKERKIQDYVKFLAVKHTHMIKVCPMSLGM